MDNHLISKEFAMQELNDRYLTETGWLKSLQSGEIIDINGDYIPWYNYAMIDFLKEKMPSDISVFEFGCGYSSIFYAKRTTCVTSVETRKPWADKINNLRKQLQLENLEINMILDQDQDMSFAIEETMTKYDLVVIDSKDRNECTVAASRHLTQNGCILIDNTERSNYKSSFDFLHNIGFKNITFTGLHAMRGTLVKTSLFYRTNNIFDI
jgi:hypothetical protein